MSGIPSFSQVILSSKTINASGGSFGNHEIVLEWSMAEMPLITNVKKPELLLAAGVLQPAEPVLMAPVAFPAEYVKIFPTIAKDHIVFYCNIPYSGSVHAAISSISGRPLIEYTVPVSNGIVWKNIPVAGFGKGLYFLSVQSASPAGEHYHSVFQFIIL